MSLITGDAFSYSYHLSKPQSFSLSSSTLYLGASLVAQTVKPLLAIRETQVQSLGREDPLEKEMATLSSILAGECYGQRSLAGYSSWGCKQSDMTEYN